MHSNEPTKFSNAQIEIPKPTKEEMGAFFSPNKAVKNSNSSPKNGVKGAGPIAQVLPYDFRPGALNIFGEVNTGADEDSENSILPTEEDFKYESENDLESILNVPSEYAGKLLNCYIFLIAFFFNKN